MTTKNLTKDKQLDGKNGKCAERVEGDSSDGEIQANVKRRVLVADPCPLVCCGMRCVIEEQSDLTCCGAVDNVLAARAAISEQAPDLVIMNLWFGAEDGLEFMKALRAEWPGLLVLVCSQQDESLWAERALRAGAVGFIQSNCLIEVLLEAIRATLAGDIFLSRKMTAVIMHDHVQGKNGGDGSAMGKLSDRELKCFLLLGAGLSSRQTAEGLKVSLKTVESYRENIKHKLGLHDAAELTHHATLFVNGQSQNGEMLLH